MRFETSGVRLSAASSVGSLGSGTCCFPGFRAPAAAVMLVMMIGTSPRSIIQGGSGKQGLAWNVRVPTKRKGAHVTGRPIEGLRQPLPAAALAAAVTAAPAATAAAIGFLKPSKGRPVTWAPFLFVGTRTFQ